MMAGLRSITVRIVFSVRCAAMTDARCALREDRKKEKAAVRKRKDKRKIEPLMNTNGHELILKEEGLWGCCDFSNPLPQAAGLNKRGFGAFAGMTRLWFFYFGGWVKCRIVLCVLCIAWFRLLCIRQETPQRKVEGLNNEE